MCGCKTRPETDINIGDRQVVKMFDRISPVYDLMNRLMSLGMDVGWRRKAIRALDINPGSLLLDLACGTGDLTKIALESCDNIQVMAVDPSQAMIDIFRRSITDKSAHLVRGWDNELPFNDGSFQRSMMAFGIRNFPNRMQALQELFRVTQTGGKLAILEMTSRSQTFLNTLFSWYFRKLVPIVGGMISRDKGAYSHLPSSVDAFPEPVDFARELTTAGWTKATWTSIAGGVVTLFLAEK